MQQSWYGLSKPGGTLVLRSAVLALEPGVQKTVSLGVLFCPDWPKAPRPCLREGQSLIWQMDLPNETMLEP